MLRRSALAASLLLLVLSATTTKAGDSGTGATIRASRVQRASEDEAASRPAGHIYQVAAVGDSLTDARSHGGKYLAWLRERCPMSRFDNYGKGGENVAQMRRRFARDVLGAPGRGKPAYTHVIVFGGVNDVLGDMSAGRSIAKIEQDIESMYAMARQAGIQVIGVTVSPWGGYTQYFNPRRAAATRQVNDWILAQWREGRIDYAIDAHELLSCGDTERLCGRFEMPWIRDGLHFNEEAHEILGRALYERVFADCL